MTSLNAVEIIRKKRNGKALSEDEIRFFVLGAVRGQIPDYQVSSWLMAVYFRGMNLDETTWLTKTMIDSGKRVQFEDEKPKVDKHSTGGVGDKISLILGPLVASLGVAVPMVAGRGLGHTGGTLDKLESIPGFQVRLSVEEFKRIVQRTGVAIMGQTEDFVPADKLLYSLRDVTATVECIPLITASILSKKVAEGISGLVLDLKVGSGAFMKTMKDAQALAKMLVEVGERLGVRVRAVLTEMSQPLGNAVGHSVEVLECIDVMKGQGPSDIRDLSVELAAHMLILAEKSSSLSAARIMAKKSLQNGAALEKFREMTAAQNATVDVAAHPELLKVSAKTFTVHAQKSGYIAKMDGEALGLLLVEMGGGRQKTSDLIDHGVGFIFPAKVGTFVKAGQPLVHVHYNEARLSASKVQVADLQKRILKAYGFNARKIKAPALIKKVVE